RGASRSRCARSRALYARPSNDAVAHMSVAAESDARLPKLAGRTLLFMHIPKTGGTSIRELLSRQFEPEAILYIGLQTREGVAARLTAAAHARFVNGHIPYAAMQSLARRPFVFTLLRDPVQRAVSAFRQMQRDAAQREEMAARGTISRERARDFAL